MNEQSASIQIAAAPERVCETPLQPLAYPDWNPAFLTLQGPAEAIVGHDYEITSRGGLPGKFGAPGSTTT
ncbi:MAG TPA: hypothetical protein VE441_02045 [Mycobacterium sp.]|nr:hypothetical protein [Mycobacterium sp.]